MVLYFLRPTPWNSVNTAGPPIPTIFFKPNELLLFFLDFFIIYYHERIIPGAQPQAIASLIAQKVS